MGRIRDEAHNLKTEDGIDYYTSQGFVIYEYGEMVGSDQQGRTEKK
jgi:hypothetical protein